MADAALDLGYLEYLHSRIDLLLLADREAIGIDPRSIYAFECRRNGGEVVKCTCQWKGRDREVLVLSVTPNPTQARTSAHTLYNLDASVGQLLRSATCGVPGQSPDGIRRRRSIRPRLQQPVDHCNTLRTSRANDQNKLLARHRRSNLGS